MGCQCWGGLYDCRDLWVLGRGCVGSSCYQRGICSSSCCHAGHPPERPHTRWIHTWGRLFGSRGRQHTIPSLEWSVFNLPSRKQRAGADVVGFNCYRGPATMLPIVERVCKAGVKIPLAALPVPYRTSQKEPTFFCLVCFSLTLSHPSWSINHYV